MEDLLKKRIAKFMESSELSVNALAKELGLQTRTLQNQLKTETAISALTLLELLFHYKELSAEWLLRGEGEMDINTNSEELALRRRVDEQAELIKRQQREIDGLYDRINELKKEGKPTAANLLVG